MKNFIQGILLKKLIKSVESHRNQDLNSNSGNSRTENASKFTSRSKRKKLFKNTNHHSPSDFFNKKSSSKLIELQSTNKNIKSVYQIK